ncbi:hypothetical protein SLS54_003262 [Diplodia seriata]
MTTIRSLLIETWVEYGFSTILVAMRLYTRFKMVGGRLQKDDYLMVLGWAFFTMMSVCAHIVSLNGDNRAMTNEQRRLLPSDERDRKILGSKFFLTGHLTYVSTIWTLKLCMLLFFQRLTRGLAAEKFVKPAIGVVAVTWLVEFFTVLFSCHPVQNNWAIYPDPGKLCTHESALWYIVQVVFNVITDAVIVPIPMPNAAPSEPAIWAMRECFVATFVGNAPMIRPMFTRKFYQGGYQDNDQSQGYTNGSVPLDAYGTGGSKNATNRMYGSKAGTNVDIESDSTENIIESSAGGKMDHGPEFGIRVQHSVAVSSHTNIPSRPSTMGDHNERSSWSPT